jgi:DNA-binding transcriptional LysR family regulator
MNEQHSIEKRFPSHIITHKLLHFLAVYDAGHIGRAASKMAVTPQAASKSISVLEAALDVKLFTRTSHGVEPTIYAKTLAGRAKIILAEAKLVAGELSSIRNSQEGAIRFGMGWSFLYKSGPEAIIRFRTRFPEVNINVVEGNSMSLYPRLIDGELEFVFSAPPYNFSIDPSLTATRLYQERDWVVFGSNHVLAKKKQVSLEDLATSVWLADFTIPGQWGAICDVFSSSCGMPPPQVINMSSFTMSKELLHSGDYVCLMNKEMIAQEVEREEFCAVPIEELSFKRWALFVERKGSPLQTVSAEMKSIIHDVCGKYYP